MRDSIGVVARAAMAAAVTASCGLLATVAQAQAPQPWQIDLQPAASPVMERIRDLNMSVTLVIAAITLLVLALLAYVSVRFHERRNPEPATFRGHAGLETLWTVIPIGILVVIAVPSLRLLHYMDKAHDAAMTVKAIGHQWYWSYGYPDHGAFEIDSIMVDDASLKPGQLRLLDVDNRLVVPVDTSVRILITSSDVVHSFSVPALGLKTDAIPGRTNETWVRVTRPGVYYGQCAQLCGVNHTYMPIAIEAVSRPDFDAWVARRMNKTASARP